jgi:N-acyl-D-aspartate/D-glutamate deacylase
MLDLLVRGGTVFDGCGSPRREVDLGIAEGRIVAIGPRLDVAAREVVDAHGLWVAPGLVDIHTHYDLEVEVAPALSESVRHGVTTVVMGNCSLSLTVGTPDVLADIFLRVETLPHQLVHRWLDRAVTWAGPHDYLRHVEELPLGPNVAALLGHSALRAHVMGLERSLGARASDAELAEMRRCAEAALKAGCIGISVDMVHWHRMSGAFAGRPLPSHHAGLREIRMLAEICRSRDAIFQVTPNPPRPTTFLAILGLCIGLFRPPLRCTILSALDMDEKPSLWRLFPLSLFLVNGLFGGNARFQTLTVPFTIFSDGPLTPLFEEFDAGVRLNNCADAEARRRLWQEPGYRADFARDWTATGMRSFHRDLARMVVVDAPDRTLVGKSFSAIAGERAADPVETFMSLLERHDEDLRWVSTGANSRAAIRQRLMAHRHILPGFTDAGAHARNLAFFDSGIALLRQAAQTRFMTMERAIHRLTGEPAAWFKLDCGRLIRGAPADVILIKPDALDLPSAEPTTIADPTLAGTVRLVNRCARSPLAAVYVGGRLAVRDGEPVARLGQDRMGRLLTGRLAANARQAQRQWRNRIGDDVPAHPFESYWPVFVMKHRVPANIAVHCAAVLLLWTAWLGFVFDNWLWLLLAPLSQLLGTLGHSWFEPNPIDRRDLAFSWRALAALHRMLLLVFIGRYRSEVRRVEAEMRRFVDGERTQALRDAA